MLYIIMTVEPIAVASQLTGGVSGPYAMRKYNYSLNVY